jgi:hypothetical protein
VQVSRASIERQDFRAHGTGEAAVQDAHQVARRDPREPFGQVAKRDAAARKVIDDGVVGDELVRLAAVPGEGDHDDVIGVA